MKPLTHELVYEIFLAVCDLAPADRAQKLNQACGQNESLRKAVESLLNADELLATEQADLLRDDIIESGRHLSELKDAATSDSQFLNDSIVSIGPFKIIRVIGEGGMGVVYEAEQEAPKRRVAVKIIRAGGSSKIAISRFRREAELLGMLQHPGIAQIFESGTHDGRPYIAMEFVDGQTLTDYADGHNLGVRDRLELVARVAEAVHHAHQKGIIHRDLKPDNILIPSDATGLISTDQADPRSEFLGIGQPKVLDFGIARAADGIAGITANHTLQGQLVGTLAYMAPEQIAADEDVDTRSDVYVLGVIAFELLSGRLPISDRGSTLAESILRRTSTGQVLLGTTGKQFKGGDIETIVAKAMRSERSGRYQSAAEFSADIRRFLASKPIEARPPSKAYLFSRFCNRNRALVGVASLAVLAVVVGSAFTGAYAMRSARLLKRQDSMLYTAMLESASRAIHEHDVDLARTMLAQAPVSRRGWEWDYLTSRTNASLRSINLENDARIAIFANIHWIDNEKRFLLPVLEGDDLFILTINAESLRIEKRTEIDVDFKIGSGAVARSSISPSGEWLVIGTAARGTTTDVFIRINVPTPEVVTTTSWQASDIVVAPEVRSDFGFFSVYTRSAQWPGDESMIDDPTLGRIAAVHDRTADYTHVQILSVPNGSELFRIPVTRKPVGPTIIALGGSIVVVPQENGHIEAFDIETALPRPWQASNPSIYSAASAAVVNEGEIIAIGTMNGRVMIFDAATGAMRASTQDTVGSIRILSQRPGTNEIISVSAAGKVSVIPIIADDPAILHGHKHWVQSLVSTGDGNTLITGDWAGSIRIWDTATGEQTGSFQFPDNGREYTKIADLSLSPDGERFAVVWSNGWLHPHHVEIRDLKSGALLEQLGSIEFGPTFARFAPDGTLFISSSIMSLGQITSSARHITNVASPVAFSNANPRIGAFGSKSGVQIFETSTMRTIRQIDGLRFAITFLVFSPDGSRLLVGGGRIAYVLRVRDGKILATLSGHTDVLLDVAWSPDGSRFATASKDNSIAIWDASTYEKLVSLYGHESYVSQIVWPTTDTLISGSGDHTIRKWSSKKPSGSE